MYLFDDNKRFIPHIGLYQAIIMLYNKFCSGGRRGVKPFIFNAKWVTCWKSYIYYVSDNQSNNHVSKYLLFFKSTCAGDPKWNRPLIESPRGPWRKCFLPPSPGDSIWAKCEMDSPEGEDISHPLVEKVAMLIKMSRIENKLCWIK